MLKAEKTLFRVYDGLSSLDTCKSFYNKSPFELSYLLAQVDSLRTYYSNEDEIYHVLGDISTQAREFETFSPRALIFLENYISQFECELISKKDFSTDIKKLSKSIAQKITELEDKSFDSVSMTIYSFIDDANPAASHRIAIRKAIAELSSSNSISPEILLQIQTLFNTESYDISFAEEVMSSLLGQKVIVLDSDGDGRFGSTDRILTNDTADGSYTVLPVKSEVIEIARLQMAVVHAAKLVSIIGKAEPPEKLSFDVDAEIEAEDIKDYVENGTYVDNFGRHRRMYWRQVFNPEYWDNDKLHATIREGVKPSDAVRNLFLNREVYQYECATDIIAIYYNAMLNYLGADQFDNDFQEIRIGLWDMSPTLKKSHRVTRERASVPGEWGYYKNHDVTDYGYADGFMGLNIIYLGKDSTGQPAYYGLDTGTAREQTIVNLLNGMREHDSNVDASLIDMKARLVPIG